MPACRLKRVLCVGGVGEEVQQINKIVTIWGTDISSCLAIYLSEILPGLWMLI